MGNCCSSGKLKEKNTKATKVKNSNFVGKGERLGGTGGESIPLSNLNSNINKPEPALNKREISEKGPDRSAILEAAEKRQKEANERGSKGEGQLSKKLQKEKGKNLKDFVEEDLKKKEAQNDVDVSEQLQSIND